MELKRDKRRLAAILVADMVGYSRLTEADGSGVLARPKAHRTELIDPVIAKNNGRIIKTNGNGMLVEFASIVDTVRCEAYGECASGRVRRVRGSQDSALGTEEML